jgi:hypothetical protein
MFSSLFTKPSRLLIHSFVSEQIYISRPITEVSCYSQFGLSFLKTEYSEMMMPGAQVEH